MNEPKRYCPNCKREVICLVERGSLYCPGCWNKFEQSETGVESGNKKEEPGLLADLAAGVRATFIFLLVLLGIFLVFLAFVYAACSGLNNI
jgi:hypothetical protein